MAEPLSSNASTCLPLSVTVTISRSPHVTCTGIVPRGPLHGRSLALQEDAVKRHVDLRDKATRRFTNPVRYCDGSTGHSLVRLKGPFPRPGLDRKWWAPRAGAVHDAA